MTIWLATGVGMAAALVWFVRLGQRRGIPVTTEPASRAFERAYITPMIASAARRNAHAVSYQSAEPVEEITTCATMPGVESSGNGVFLRPVAGLHIGGGAAGTLRGTAQGVFELREVTLVPPHDHVPAARVANT